MILKDWIAAATPDPWGGLTRPGTASGALDCGPPRSRPEDPRPLRLFAGCGIVAAADPADEWAESEAKLEPMRRALGLQ